ncbi:hypothetical protein OHT57_46985 [Streptomyces sp. NBC_00285]|uniref:hypothetical protein n=1 Tax=Streptomyces sp. NBC_00285 TaxID=2975700 RepID=UPI002E2A9699|nr:hypothetical protein [Streptomyces sp. NBC_00285]
MAANAATRLTTIWRQASSVASTTSTASASRAAGVRLRSASRTVAAVGAARDAASSSVFIAGVLLGQAF